MYICLCHAISDGAVRACCREEPDTVAEVYRALGVRPECGKCVPMVVQILREAAEPPPGGDD
jgi:bacterioferritin-associated ferredoxin